MKIALILVLCSIFVVTAIVFSSHQRIAPRQVEETSSPLDYDDMILLDAEYLAEGGIGSSYYDEVLPILRQYIDTTADVDEDLQPDIPSYKVSCLGREYLIYTTSEIQQGEGDSWGNATFALFDIVNRQLSASQYKFYAISGGNDLGGMFLTLEMYDEAVKSLERKTDWPYLPKLEPPWYGEPHDN